MNKNIHPHESFSPNEKHAIDGAVQHSKAGKVAQQEGDVTPGMRPDDSSQTGIATNAEGTPSTLCDPETVEKDVQHAQRVIEEQNKHR